MPGFSTTADHVTVNRCFLAFAVAGIARHSKNASRRETACMRAPSGNAFFRKKESIPKALLKTWLREKNLPTPSILLCSRKSFNARRNLTAPTGVHISTLFFRKPRELAGPLQATSLHPLVTSEGSGARRLSRHSPECTCLEPMENQCHRVPIRGRWKES